jgi:hypothetical protein
MVGSIFYQIHVYLYSYILSWKLTMLFWWLTSIGGQANFFFKSANSQILGHILLLQIRKFFRCASPQTANPQILWLIRKSQICKFLQSTAQLFRCGLSEVLNPQFKKYTVSSNRKSAKCHIYRRSANLTHSSCLQNYGFAICGDYLRTAHLC